MQNARTIVNQTPILALAGLLSACMVGSAAAQSHTILAGDMDDFGNSNDPDDTLVIRPLLADWLARPNGNNVAYYGGEPMPFDAVGYANWDFGYTFFLGEDQMLGSEAKLTIRLQSNTGSLNDALFLQYTGDGNTLSELWRMGITELNGGTWAPGETATFELDLGNLPGGVNIIDDINSVGYLDVFVLDDTAVDWIQLTIPAPGTASLLFLGGVAAMRRRRR